jgi:hypothetical protein
MPFENILAIPDAIAPPDGLAHLRTAKTALSPPNANEFDNATLGPRLMTLVYLLRD